MTKIGVGVGEEFPVDEQARPQPEEDHEQCGGHDWHREREMRREAWRRFRHQMHEEWHARRRAFRDRVRQQDDVEVLGPDHRHIAHLVIGGLALIGLAALLNHHRH